MTPKERFMRKVFVRRGDCWLWTASRDSCGYGTFYFERKIVGAHRASYQMSYGKIPKGLCVCHRCDVPNCVNPEHLFLATQQENISDMYNKNRVKRWGDAAGNVKLSERDVRNIRRMFNSGICAIRISEKYPFVNSSTIYKIVKNKHRVHEVSQ